MHSKAQKAAKANSDAAAEAKSAKMAAVNKASTTFAAVAHTIANREGPKPGQIGGGPKPGLHTGV